MNGLPDPGPAGLQAKLQGEGPRKGLGFASLAPGVLLAVRGVEAFEGIQLLPKGAEPAQPSLWIDQDFERAVAQARAEGPALRP